MTAPDRDAMLADAEGLIRRFAERSGTSNSEEMSRCCGAFSILAGSCDPTADRWTSISHAAATQDDLSKAWRSQCGLSPETARIDTHLTQRGNVPSAKTMGPRTSVRIFSINWPQARFMTAANGRRTSVA